jgi:hypothetical protein
MNHFRDCHREERSDVAIQLIDCSRGFPQSPRLLRNDKRDEFICSSGVAQRRSNPVGSIATPSFIGLAMTSGG